MEKTDEEILASLQKLVSDLNKAMSDASINNIEVNIKTTSVTSMGGVPSFIITFDAFKRLTPRYVNPTGW